MQYTTNCGCFCLGNALLTVGMITPKGNPVDELNVKKSKINSYMVIHTVLAIFYIYSETKINAYGQFQVTYKTSEKGDHPLVIRWGADDIPGSPFTVTV